MVFSYKTNKNKHTLHEKTSQYTTPAHPHFCHGFTALQVLSPDRAKPKHDPETTLAITWIHILDPFLLPMAEGRAVSPPILATFHLEKAGWVGRRVLFLCIAGPAGHSGRCWRQGVGGRRCSRDAAGSDVHVMTGDPALCNPPCSSELLLCPLGVGIQLIFQ